MQWNYLACPAENECLNGHHTCHSEVETCVDQNIGECNNLLSNCDLPCVLDGFMTLNSRMSYHSYHLFVLNGYYLVALF